MGTEGKEDGGQEDRTDETGGQGDTANEGVTVHTHFYESRPGSYY